MFKKVLIADDEPLALDRLERMLIKLGVEQVIRAQNYYEALSRLKEDPEIRVAFLDIKMPGKTGLELAEDISSLNREIVIIFQTAYPDFALQGFKVGAVDYLVKPYTLEEVQQALERARKFLGEGERKYLQVETTSGEKRLVQFDDIVYVKADLKHSLVRTKDGFLFCTLSLGELEKKLQKYGFMRIHRSYLVNLAQIRVLENEPSGKILIKFRVPVEDLLTSKSGAHLLRDRIKRLRE